MPNHELMYMFRVLLACACGAIIGIERQRRVKVAGLKTHMMIAVAAALMMIISKYGFMDVVGISEGVDYDVSRVAAGIITGMGILSGGIVFTSKQGYVSGITTAAGMWATIGIGMAIGAGMYSVGIGTMLLVIVIQLILHMNLTIFKKPTKGHVLFLLNNDDAVFERIEKELSSYHIRMNQFKWERKSDDVIRLRCQVVIPAKYDKSEVIRIITSFSELETFEFE